MREAGCIADAGASGCTDPAIDSLEAASAVAVSPNGSSVYVASASDDSITHFTRQTTPDPPGGGGGPGAGAGADTTPPDTAISDGPKNKERKGKATFAFTSTEPGSTFECKLDDGAFEPCASPDDLKVKKGKHSFEVRATDAAGNTDPTPASDSWKVKKKK